MVLLKTVKHATGWACSILLCEVSGLGGCSTDRFDSGLLLVRSGRSDLGSNPTLHTNANVVSMVKRWLAKSQLRVRIPSFALINS